MNLTKTVPTKRGRTLGLAPLGMTVLLPGKAYVIGKEGKGKIPLMESNSETYNWMQTVKLGKAAKDNRRLIKRLKKTGKVATLAPYMFGI